MGLLGVDAGGGVEVRCGVVGDGWIISDLEGAVHGFGAVADADGEDGRDAGGVGVGQDGGEGAGIGGVGVEVEVGVGVDQRYFLRHLVQDSRVGEQVRGAVGVE